MKETVRNAERSVSNMIDSNIEILDGVAITIGEIEMIDLEHLLPVIREINDRNSFYRMGFIRADGKGDMVDLDGYIHEDVDFSGEDFFMRAMQGTNSLSDTVKDKRSGIYLNYYGVPVVSGGTVVGVLAAADKTERIRIVLDAPIFGGGGYSNIIGSDGQYIVRSIKSPEIFSICDIGDFSEEETERIRKGLKDGTENFFTFTKNGSSMCAMIIPLGRGEWFLAGIVEEKLVNGSYYSVMGITLIIVSAMIIFSFLAYCINSIQTKNEIQLEKLAYHDSLLGIDNFIKFSMDMQHQLAHGEFSRLAFWYCDLDDFKIYNEFFGYEAGDHLLKSIAGVFEELSGHNDLFCRENADHFAGIRHYRDQDELKVWYESVMEAIDRYELPGHNAFRLKLTMGFYCADTKEKLLTVNEMYNRAKMAQKSIKQTKNVKYAFYSDKIRQLLLREKEIESNMKTALSEGRFKVYIQPKTAIFEDNRISGGEALVRWEDPEKGLVSPAEFIPLFEKNGFIIPLDRYMFEQVCRWMNSYLEGGGRPIRIAVNVSKLGILQEDFVEFYAVTKRQYHIPDGMLELEFTESLALEDNAMLRRIILELKKEGFICSLDDFGSGYSSLNVLKDLPIQVLKLDVLFFRGVSDIDKAWVIVENIIHMAKQLNIRTVAEGVEEAEQIEHLRKCGCDIIQGYVFSRPLPADKFKELVETDPRGNWGDGFKEKA